MFFSEEICLDIPAAKWYNTGKSEANMFSIPHTFAEAARIVLATVKKPTDRASLIAACVKNTAFSDEERADRTPAAPLNRAKCLYGNAINFLLKNERLVSDGELVSLKKEESEEEAVDLATRDSRIRDLILSIVEKEKPSRAKLLENVFLQYVEKYGEIERDIIRADAGRLIKGMLDEKEIKGDKSMYSLPKVMTNEEKFNKLSSETFETASVLLLCKLCETHGYTAKGAVTDGPQDGGIDGEVSFTDEFGHREKYILQMKYYTSKNRKYVPEVEVREFLGVLSASDATRGYFLTNAKYDKTTKSLVQRYSHKYIALIDGTTWLDLSNKIGFDIPIDR